MINASAPAGALIATATASCRVTATVRTAARATDVRPPDRRSDQANRMRRSRPIPLASSSLLAARRRRRGSPNSNESSGLSSLSIKGRAALCSSAVLQPQVCRDATKGKGSTRERNRAGCLHRGRNTDLRSRSGDGGKCSHREELQSKAAFFEIGQRSSVRRD